MPRTFVVGKQPFYGVTFGEKIKLKNQVYVSKFWILNLFFEHITPFFPDLDGKPRFPQSKVHILFLGKILVWFFFVFEKKKFLIFFLIKSIKPIHFIFLSGYKNRLFY